MSAKNVSIPDSFTNPGDEVKLKFVTVRGVARHIDDGLHEGDDPVTFRDVTLRYVGAQLFELEGTYPRYDYYRSHFLVATGFGVDWKKSPDPMWDDWPKVKVKVNVPSKWFDPHGWIFTKEVEEERFAEGFHVVGHVHIARLVIHGSSIVVGEIGGGT
jgi:hypothetical protein